MRDAMRMRMVHKFNCVCCSLGVVGYRVVYLCQYLREKLRLAQLHETTSEVAPSLPSRISASFGKCRLCRPARLCGDSSFRYHIDSSRVCPGVRTILPLCGKIPPHYAEEDENVRGAIRRVSLAFSFATAGLVRHAPPQGPVALHHRARRDAPLDSADAPLPSWAVLLGLGANVAGPRSSDAPNSLDISCACRLRFIPFYLRIFTSGIPLRAAASGVQRRAFELPTTHLRAASCMCRGPVCSIFRACALSPGIPPAVSCILRDCAPSAPRIHAQWREPEVWA
ncbi:hypothetical protein C8R44DRAFT_865638 [Mycena epipterygia]|nr:hypothetical protein C8R44DRAFT_865638 [Mycena epipterygia]